MMQANRKTRAQHAGSHALQIGGNVSNGSIVAAGTGVTIIVQQSLAQEPNPPPANLRMTPEEVHALLQNMPDKQRTAVYKFMCEKLLIEILQGLDELPGKNGLLRVQRYAETVINNSNK